MLARCQRERGQPTLAELTTLLKGIFALFPNRYLVLDGLDEMPKDAQAELIKLLASLDVNILVTSRPLELLESKLDELRQTSKPVFIDVVAQDEDIELFISESLDRNPEFACMIRSHDVREAMIAKIKTKSRGM